MTASSDQADSRVAAGDGRILLPIMTSTSKTAPSIYTFNTEINSTITPLHRPLWKKQRQKYYFLSTINCGRSATVEKFGPAVPWPMRFIRAMVIASRKLDSNTNLKNVFHRSTIIASLPTLTMVFGGFERVGCRHFARKYVEIKGKLWLLPIFVRSLIIE